MIGIIPDESQMNRLIVSLKNNILASSVPFPFCNSNPFLPDALVSRNCTGFFPARLTTHHWPLSVCYVPVKSERK